MVHSSQLSHANNFDGLRIIAATMVIIGHSYVIGQVIHPTILQSGLRFFAVEVFFAISGYLVVKSFLFDPNFERFLAKRALRIFPALIGLVIITTCVVGPLVTILPLSDYFFQPSFSKYFNAITLKHSNYLSGVFDNNGNPRVVNASLWILPIEFFMYLCVMFLGAFSLVFARKNRLAFDIIWTVFTLGLIIGYICILQFEIVDGRSVNILNRFNLHGLLRYAPFFAVGGMVFLAERYTTRQIPAIILIVMAILLQIDQSALLKIVAIIFIPIIIIRIGNASWPVLRDLGRWGDISYGTYLYGYLVGRVLQLYLSDVFPFMVLLTLTILITYVLGFLSWHLVEKRALALKPRGK